MTKHQQKPKPNKSIQTKKDNSSGIDSLSRQMAGQPVHVQMKLLKPPAPLQMSGGGTGQSKESNGQQEAPSLSNSDIQKAVRYNKRQGFTKAQIRGIQNHVGVKDDGAFGPNTVRAVVSYQHAHGLTADGMVGPITLSALKSDGLGAVQENTPEDDIDSAPGASPEQGGGEEANQPAEGSLTANFTLDEFKCRDGTPVPRQYYANVKELAENLEIIRAALGNKSMHINSGYRTPSYNARIGGAKSSQHMLAKAGDFTVSGYTPAQVRQKIEELIRQGKIKDGGLGAYNTFTHYDVRNGRARW